MIPREYAQEVVRRNDIISVVSSYVQLRNRGRTSTGLCPFHTEKTPSFVVYPENQSFYCFGCGAGGDTINFIRRIENLDYTEAVKLLAARAGMPLPEEDDKAGRLRTRVLAANRDAAYFYFRCLNGQDTEAQTARAYWRGRGLSDETIRRFGLGYAPAGFHALRDALHARGYNDEELLAAGLIKRSAKGNLYDAFYGRVMTPIFDLRGDVIAFGGRVLGDEKPKYVNTQDTVVYKKSRTMFALNLAKRSKTRRYILCEGYMDVISMQQAGFDTAVAACGTALTTEQVKLLEEYAEEVVLCYDSDEAGQKATARSLGLFANSPLRVSVLSIPGAKDPDEFIKKYGRERFAALLDGSHNATEYKLGLIRQKYDITQPAGRVDYIKDAVGLLAALSSPVEQDVYVGRLAEETDVTKANITAQLQAETRKRRRIAGRERQKRLLGEGIAGQVKVPYTLGGDKALGVATAEQQLLAAMLQNNQFVPYIRQRLTPEGFMLPETQAACRAIYQCADEGAPLNLTALGPLLPDETLVLLAQLLARNADLPIQQADVDMYLERIQHSLPKSTQAGGMSEEALEEYLDKLKQRKK